MRYQAIIIPALALCFALLNGCGLFEKKPPGEEEKSTQQIIQEQHGLNRKLDSLKNIQLDKDIDSLRIVLDSSKKTMNETMEKLMKSGNQNDRKDRGIK